MQSLRHVPRLVARRGLVSQLRANSNISGGSMGRAWQDKEHAAESSYFNKKDAELLAKLAGKLHAQTAVRPLSCFICFLRSSFSTLDLAFRQQTPDQFVRSNCAVHLFLSRLLRYVQPTEQVLAKEKDTLKALFTKHSVTAPEALIDDVCSQPSLVFTAFTIRSAINRHIILLILVEFTIICNG